MVQNYLKLSKDLLKIVEICRKFSSGISSGKNFQLRPEPEPKPPDPASEPEPAPVHP